MNPGGRANASSEARPAGRQKPARAEPAEPPVGDALRIPIASLTTGTLERLLVLEAPSEALGDLPLPFEQLEAKVEMRRVRDDAGSRGVRVRGTLAARAQAPCRRCLDLVGVEVTGRWSALFRLPSRITPGEDGVWPLSPEAGELDLAGPVREELWVRTPGYVLCANDCRGLCPQCGARLAHDPCTCPPPPPDPRWSPLTQT